MMDDNTQMPAAASCSSSLNYNQIRCDDDYGGDCEIDWVGQLLCDSSSNLSLEIINQENEKKKKEISAILMRDYGDDNSNDIVEGKLEEENIVVGDEELLEEKGNYNYKGKMALMGNNRNNKRSSSSNNNDNNNNNGMPRIAFQTKSDEDVLDDGYRWRKYGQKAVKHSKHPRSYYRCTHHTCNVKKQIQRHWKDPSIVVTTYEGIHNHPSEKLMETLSPLLKQLQFLSGI